jgi:hypothetical protein
MGANLPLAQAYRDVLSDTAEELAGERPTHRGRWFETRQGPAPCPACAQQAEFTNHLIKALRQALTDTTFYNQFSSSDGLCLRHLQLTIELRPLQDQGTWLPLLRQAQITCLQRLHGQLSELIRKHDYRFQGEVQGDEMLSWKTAAGLVAGEDERAQ